MNLNTEDFAKRVAKETGQSAKEIEATLRITFDVLARTLAAEESYSIPNFGTFETVERPARPANNPATGERIQLPARRVVRFRPTGRIKQMVRDGDTTATIRKGRTKS